MFTRLGGLARRGERGAPSGLLPAPRTAGVYVDVENLGDDGHARDAVRTVVRGWREELPLLTRICLYVPAARVGLWEAWGTGLDSHDVLVRPIQRFGRTSKNAADLAIVADAIADFTTGTVNHVAVVSNDSDFGVLFVKLRELSAARGSQFKAPFLWINVDGKGGGLSSEIAAFIPDTLRWTIPSIDDAPPVAQARQAGEKETGAGLPANLTIVGWLLAELPQGRFKAEDVRKILARHCPKHPAAQTKTACGTFVSQQLMPLLGDSGVKVIGQKPRVYERGS